MEDSYSSSVLNHSCVCDDVKQALKKCKPPTNFELVESHLSSAQKPCGPKHTFADLSQIENLLQPQEVGYNLESNRDSNLWPGLQTHTTSHWQRNCRRAETEKVRVCGAPAAERSCSAKFSGECDANNMMRERKMCEQPDRARNPEVPEFLKKFLVKKRELGDDGHQMYSARSVQNRIRGAAGAYADSRESPAEWIHNSAFKGNEKNSQHGSEDNQAVHLPGSPDSFLVYHTAHKGLKSEDDKETCVNLFAPGSQSEASSMDGIMSYSPPHFPSHPKDSETEVVSQMQHELTSSKEGAGVGCESRLYEASNSFFVTVETLLEGRAALKKVHVPEKSENNATGGIKTSKQELDSPKAVPTATQEIRETLCREVRKGVNLRKAVSEPLQESKKQMDNLYKRNSMMEISNEMLMHVQNIRASIQHDSDSSQTSCD